VLFLQLGLGLEPEHYCNAVSPHPLVQPTMRMNSTALTLGWGVHQHTVSFSRSIGFLIDHLFDADTLLVDTGSSNTWIGANKAYVQTSTSVDTGDIFVSIRGVYSFFIIPTASSILNTAHLSNHPRLGWNTWTQ